jgi:hypothetical protein
MHSTIRTGLRFFSAMTKKLLLCLSFEHSTLQAVCLLCFLRNGVEQTRHGIGGFRHGSHQTCRIWLR